MQQDSESAARADLEHGVCRHVTRLALRHSSPRRIAVNSLANRRFLDDESPVVSGLAVFTLLGCLGVLGAIVLLPAIGPLSWFALHEWMHQHPMRTGLGFFFMVTVGPGLILYAVLALANLALLAVFVLVLPFQMLGCIVGELKAAKVVARRFQEVLGTWLSPDQVLGLLDDATRSTAPSVWVHLNSHDELFTRLIELENRVMFQELPICALPEIARHRLSENAFSILVQWGLADSITARALLPIWVRHGDFRDPIRSCVLIHRLGTLTPGALALLLDTVCSLDVDAHDRYIAAILSTAQKADGEIVGRFAEAMSLVTLAVCEAALA